MDLELRKFTKFVDKTFIEGGKKAKEPVLLVSVAAVFKNPWHGKGFVEDLISLLFVEVLHPDPYDFLDLSNDKPISYNL